MQFANVKALATKAMVAAVAAGALLFAAPTQSQAQVVVGLRFGRPAPIVAPVYVHPGPNFFARREEFARREAFLRHQEWLRAHRFDRPYGYR
jgi:ABC-type sugar transport system substrate-binding protein